MRKPDLKLKSTHWKDIPARLLLVDRLWLLSLLVAFFLVKTTLTTLGGR